MRGRADLWRGAWAAAFVGLPSALAVAQHLVVVSSGDTAPYAQALAGVQKVGVSVAALQLGADPEPDLPAVLAHAPRDTAVVTLGAAAAEYAAHAMPAVPVVNCMVLGSDPAASAVPLEVPVEAQLASMRRLLPNARNVGILFDPAQNERRAVDAAAALTRAGYTPVLEPVTGPTALPLALNRLANRVDVLFALPDTTVYARESARALLLFSFRHQIPMVGPTEAWVKAGALYALDWDYTDLGRYCGALAVAKLAGGKQAPPVPPAMRLVANARSAEQLRVTWDAEAMGSFDKVYK
ncbi:MAG TPA: ABC transporter substrate binding protein [Casimicrobiaceae bacterium]|nr:ABC transporter substrate binding protein [Casimicrobiaceae bacterium]